MTDPPPKRQTPRFILRSEATKKRPKPLCEYYVYILTIKARGVHPDGSFIPKWYSVPLLHLMHLRVPLSGSW